MSMVRWEPFRDFRTLQEEMDRMFGEAFRRTAASPLGEVYVHCDMWETSDDLFVRCAVPGARPEDVNITVTGETLTVGGKIQSLAGAEEARNYTWYLRELRTGDFSRTFTLPTSVNAEQAEASFEHGLLTLRLPKTPEVRPKRIPIRTGAAGGGPTPQR